MSPTLVSRTLAARNRERGGALAVAVVFVVLCSAAAAAAITVARGWQSEASTDTGRENAFQLAESGVDWAVARMRASHGVLPTAQESGAIGGLGTWTVRYGPGDGNGADDDGDGDVDESDERRFTAILATGTAGGVDRSIRVLLRAPVIIVGFDGATVLNANNPIFDVNGNAFRIEGAEHMLDGTLDPLRPEKYAIYSPADPADIQSQVPSMQLDQLVGRGGTPSIGQGAPVDLNSLISQAQLAATQVLTPGTYSGETYGTPVAGGTEVVSCVGDLHLSGGTSGAGILVVDGDLTITGGFTWVGMVLVRGRARMNGGGSGKRIIGSLIVGEEVGTPSITVTVGGNVDLLYSTDAIELAKQGLVIPAVVMWREAGTP